ncbi:acetolactate synthase 2 small subunit [Seminibacterium arietis]|uniref:Acetolactate synthase 2 small subunit n=1 Tax=Seminibacterium arietis TaxID=1173502 RepID=A0ABW3I8I6_9PAST
MKQYELSMIFNKRPETLERILRVVRHRGYDVIDLKSKTDENQIDLQLRIQSKRAVELLVNQLIKLPDMVKLKQI